jgi:hypothetical protein
MIQANAGAEFQVKRGSASELERNKGAQQAPTTTAHQVISEVAVQQRLAVLGDHCQDLSAHAGDAVLVQTQVHQSLANRGGAL